jgi:hypothetical protein
MQKPRIILTSQLRASNKDQKPLSNKGKAYSIQPNTASIPKCFIVKARSNSFVLSAGALVVFPGRSCGRVARRSLGSETRGDDVPRAEAAVGREPLELERS